MSSRQLRIDQPPSPARISRAGSRKARAEHWLRSQPWRWKLVVPVLVAQGIFVIPYLLTLSEWPAKDWAILTDAGARIVAGVDPYDVAGVERLRFSPLLAYFFAFITPIGMAGWTVLSFVFLAVLRDWRLIAVVVTSLPFWIDIATGVTFLPVPVLAIAALRGSFGASLGFVALAALIPRPLMLPVLGWLLWHDPRLRVPALLVMAALTAGAFATGWADEWIADLMRVAGGEDPRRVIQPAAFLGPLWFAVVALGVWLGVKGRLGLASLAFPPYWNPSYLMLLIVELAKPKGRDRPPPSHAEEAVRR